MTLECVMQWDWHIIWYHRDTDIFVAQKGDIKINRYFKVSNCNTVMLYSHRWFVNIFSFIYVNKYLMSIPMKLTRIFFFPLLKLRKINIHGKRRLTLCESDHARIPYGKLMLSDSVIVIQCDQSLWRDDQRVGGQVTPAPGSCVLCNTDHHKWIRTWIEIVWTCRYMKSLKLHIWHREAREP